MNAQAPAKNEQSVWKLIESGILAKMNCCHPLQMGLAAPAQSAGANLFVLSCSE
jgi:hypothetical protein